MSIEYLLFHLFDGFRLGFITALEFRIDLISKDVKFLSRDLCTRSYSGAVGHNSRLRGAFHQLGVGWRSRSLALWTGVCGARIWWHRSERGWTCLSEGNFRTASVKTLTNCMSYKAHKFADRKDC